MEQYYVGKKEKKIREGRSGGPGMKEELIIKGERGRGGRGSSFGYHNFWIFFFSF